MVHDGLDLTSGPRDRVRIHRGRALGEHSEPALLEEAARNSAVLDCDDQAAEDSLSYLELLSETEPAEPTDGRAARSHRTKRAIINAMRALHAEGELRPTAPRIAERAGVSLRTVWQQFADMEALLVESVRRDSDILRSLVRRIEPDQPLAARVDTFVSQRARVLEEMTPTWRAARLARPTSAELQSDHRRKTDAGRAELELVFAPEFDQLQGKQRDQLVEALHAISIWSFWESLRTDLGLSPLRARELVRNTFVALFLQAGFQIAR